MRNLHWLIPLLRSTLLLAAHGTPLSSVPTISMHEESRLPLHSRNSGAACSSELTGLLAGSSLLQNAEIAKKTESFIVSDKQLSQVDTSALVHGGAMDRTMNDLVTLFFVMALLVLIMVLGFIIVESSYKSRPGGGVATTVPPAGPGRRHDFEYDENAYAAANGGRLSAAREPLPRASVTRPTQQAPRPSVPTGVQPYRPSMPPVVSAPSVQAPFTPEPSTLYLCGNELVVPDGRECNLEIPSIQHQSSTSDRIELTINDSQQSCILRGVIYKAPLPDGTRILLKSKSDDMIWGRCKESGRRSCLSMHGRNDQEKIFGHIHMSAGVVEFNTVGELPRGMVTASSWVSQRSSRGDGQCALDLW